MTNVQMMIHPVGTLTAKYNIIVTKPIDTCSSSK